MVIIMNNEIENGFKGLVDEFDDFLTTEEKELGCLTAEEHSNFIKIRNYIDDVFMRVINAEDKQPKKQNTDTTATVSIIVDNDDEGGADICFMKRSHQMEI